MHFINCHEESNNQKYTLQLNDGVFIEAALFEHCRAIHFCLPSQVGCSMGCHHCATSYATVPYLRNLFAEELNELIDLLQEKIWDENLPKILSFSGHGEPMQNWDSVLESMHRYYYDFLDIYVTSIGIVDTMDKILSETDIYPSIYFSIHGSCDRERNNLIPMAYQKKAANLQQIIDFGKAYSLQGGRIVWNYMLCSVNSSEESADQLLKLCSSVDYPLEIRFTKYINIHKANGICEVRDAAACSFFNKISEQVDSNIQVRLSILEGEEIGIACGQMRAFLQKECDRMTGGNKK